MRTVVIYHADLDGKCAAAVVVKKFPEALCLETNYDLVFPVDQIQEHDTVYMVDFTPDLLADFQRLMEKTEDIHWIDHHGKNIAKYPFYNKALKGLRVEFKPSGAMLTWHYLYPTVPPPSAVEHTSDYDCWIFDFGILTKNFEAGMQSIPHDPHAKIWLDLLSDDPWSRADALKEVLAKGEIINEFRKQYNKEIVKACAFECELDGNSIIACNCPCVGSRLFDSLDTSKYDMMSVFRTNGHSVVVSLYSEHKNIDCGELAQKFGGGGHKGAAGFECTNLPFTEIKPLQ